MTDTKENRAGWAAERSLHQSRSVTEQKRTVQRGQQSAPYINQEHETQQQSTPVAKWLGGWSSHAASGSCPSFMATQTRARQFCESLASWIARESSLPVRLSQNDRWAGWPLVPFPVHPPVLAAETTGQQQGPLMLRKDASSLHAVKPGMYVGFSSPERV
eukprot:1159469-Pelagomonas_calceolata.AAC.5